MQTTLYLDDNSVSAMKDLPSKMSASKITRWMLKTAVSDNRQLKKLLKSDAEYKEVQDYLRPRLMELLRIDEEQRKKIVKFADKVGL